VSELPRDAIKLLSGLLQRQRGRTLIVDAPLVALLEGVLARGVHLAAVNGAAETAVLGAASALTRDHSAVSGAVAAE